MIEMTLADATKKADEYSLRFPDSPSVSRVLVAEIRRLQSHLQRDFDRGFIMNCAESLGLIEGEK